MSDPLASTTLSYAAYAESPADGQRWECFRLAGGTYVATAAARGSSGLPIPDQPGLSPSLEQRWP